MTKRINYLYIFIIILTILFFLNNCSQLRESAGVNRKAPDEYTVFSEPTLALPPDYNLLPPEDIVSKESKINNQELSKEILFGLSTDSENQENIQSSSALDLILEKSGANNTSNNVRDEINSLEDSLLSSKGVFAGERYMTDEAILDAAKESERLRENMFNNKSILDGDIPITTRPLKKDRLINRLFN